MAGILAVPGSHNSCSRVSHLLVSMGSYELKAC